MTATTAATLHVSDVLALAYIIEACATTAKVALADDDGVITYGHARHVSYKNDVREGTVRITTRSGMERFLPVSFLVEAYHNGTFREYEW